MNHPLRNLLLVFLALLTPLALHANDTPSADNIFQAGKKALRVEKDFPKAISLFQSYVDTDTPGPRWEEGLNLLAESYWSNRQIDEAIWTFEKEILRGNDPAQRSTALFRQAMALMAKGDDSQGMKAYAKLAREYPQGHRASIALMVQANYALLEESNRLKAIGLYEQIAKNYPDSDEAKAALGWLPSLREMSTGDLRDEVKTMKTKEAKASKSHAK